MNMDSQQGKEYWKECMVSKQYIYIVYGAPPRSLFQVFLLVFAVSYIDIAWYSQL
jgi:hypothetical protein